VKRILTVPVAFLAVWSLLVLFLCTACTDHHRGDSRTCLTASQRHACDTNPALRNLTMRCDLPDCPVRPEPCEDGHGHGDRDCD
jgi:hypothetical protein